MNNFLYLSCFIFLSTVSKTLFATGISLSPKTDNEASSIGSSLLPFTRHEVLKEGIYNVTWVVDTTSKRITFSVAVKTEGYVGFGISYKGGMNEADIVIGGVFPNGTHYFSDRYSSEKSTPIIDSKQDYTLHSAYESDGHTFLNFSRHFDTCDEKDIPINDDTLNIIWAIGETDTITQHSSHSRGNVAVNFLDPVVEVANLSQFKTWRIAKEVVLPDNDTVYLCNFFRGPPISKKHHVIGFDMFFENEVSKRHTHHSDFFRCKAPKGQRAEDYFSKYLDTTYDCYNDHREFPVDNCQMFEFQWSIGGKLTLFPENVGSPIGEEEETEFFMTEVHYDNPKKVPNLLIHSGMNFYYTDNLRPIEAGFIFVGQWSTKLYSITVPPNSQDFIVNSHCPSECTSLLPKEGVNVFLYLLHSHLSGRKQKVRHFRNGNEIPYLANDEHYDFNYQNNRLLREHVKILPGDSLSLECTYDTKWKKGKAVTGGRSPREEMCQTFLMYYPRTRTVNQCGTYFPQADMLKYMGIDNVTKLQGEIDPTVLSPPNLAGKKYSQVVEEIDWTLEKRQEFQRFVRDSKHNVYCLPHEEYTGKSFSDVSYPEFSKAYVEPSVCLPLPSPKPSVYLPVIVGVVLTITLLIGVVAFIVFSKRQKYDRKRASQ